ncbi:SAM-dependent methyltransferase, partial [Amycolatopsis mediterranei]
MTQENITVGAVFERLLGPRAEVSITAYDGSRSGPADAAVGIEVRSPLALDYLMSSPGDLGLARAYVAGALDVKGDLYTALRALATQVDQLTPAD